VKPPEHEPNPAFTKAAEAKSAWRFQQIAALTESQRRIYEEARRKADEKIKEKQQDLARREKTEIIERMKKKIREDRRLEMSPAGSTTKKSIVTERMIDDHMKRGEVPGFDLARMAIHNLRDGITREVRERHAQQLKAAEQQEQQKIDNMLRVFERGRQLDREQERKTFRRAVLKDKAKSRFNRARGKDEEDRER
jgi:hypothetical protein